MARSKTSKSWLREHHDDQFVQKARIEGYRSRAVYKLKEINDKDKLLKSNSVVVDLGAAPGGWSQFAVQQIGAKGQVFALDILPMDAIAGVTFIEGDFREEQVLTELLTAMAATRADLVMSDMAPNISGIREVDQPRAMYLAELALDLAGQVGRPGSDFLAKVFQGEGFDDFVRNCRAKYQKVIIRKPEASRARSREVYVLARGFR